MTSDRERAHNDPSEGTTHWNGCGDVGTLEHAGCKKRAELPVTLDPGDYAAGFSDGYGRGMTDAARHVIDQIAMAWESGYGEGHAEGYDQGREQGDNDARVILLDLIVELRAAHDLGCDGCGDGYPCMTGDAYLRAEARLRLREVDNPRRAWHDGRAAGRAEVAVVLLDLIAELRDGGCWERFIAGDGYTSIGHNDGWAKDIADRAEARLREVTGDE